MNEIWQKAAQEATDKFRARFEIMTNNKITKNQE